MIIDAEAGENIYSFANRITNIAKQEDSTELAIFNGIELEAHPDNTVREIVYLYNYYCLKRRSE